MQDGLFSEWVSSRNPVWTHVWIIIGIYWTNRKVWRNTGDTTPLSTLSLLCSLFSQLAGVEMEMDELDITVGKKLSTWRWRKVGKTRKSSQEVSHLGSWVVWEADPQASWLLGGVIALIVFRKGMNCGYLIYFTLYIHVKI